MPDSNKRRDETKPALGWKRPVIAGASIIALVGLVLLAVVLALTLPNLLSRQERTIRAELAPNLNGIRAAEIAHFAAYNAYVVVEPAVPREVANLDEQRAEWPAGTAFDKLGWAPASTPYGTYWVESKGDDFVVHGMVDGDGDDTPAHYTATKDISATMVTDPGVF